MIFANNPKESKTYNKYTAFSLAEVLITLAVIGVVAAISIPSLLQNTNNKEYKTTFKKSYSDINQAYEMIKKDECGGSFKGCLSSAEIVKNTFKKYLSAQKDCAGSPTFGGLGTGVSNSGCFAPQNEIKNYYGYTSNFENANRQYLPGLTLNSGVSLAFYHQSELCDNHAGYAAPDGYDRCGFIVVDVNGPKKPNRFGKDIFRISYTADRLIPEGAFTDCHIYCLYSTESDQLNGYGCSIKVLNNIDY